MDYLLISEKYRVANISGRYITNKNMIPFLEDVGNYFDVFVAGESVQNNPIYAVKIGTGKIKVYLWSQMHGNESTCTKALFDLINFLKSDDEYAAQIKTCFTLLCVPIANPDGAEAYTRFNANEIDLNRDSVALSQPESRLLRKLFDDFKPDFCFNLHDQRTIFGVGATGKPATLSFLAPSYDFARNINPIRQQAINVIVGINDELQKHIPGQVGRFDDSFNINCIGDRFQSLNVPTILFEAGHFQNDYTREQTRKYVVLSFLRAFEVIYKNEILYNKTTEYFKITQNSTVFYDVIYRNVKINIDGTEKIINFASQFKEILFNNSIMFESRISAINDLNNFYGHVEYDFKGNLFQNSLNAQPELDSKANFVIGDKRIVNGLLEK